MNKVGPVLRRHCNFIGKTLALIHRTGGERRATLTTIPDVVACYVLSRGVQLQSGHVELVSNE